MSIFDRKKYNSEYYQRNKIRLDKKRLLNYHRNKGIQAFTDYVNNHLNEDMAIIRDELVKVDANNPYCLELMTLARILLIMRCHLDGDDIEEIERIKNIPISNAWNAADFLNQTYISTIKPIR